MRCRRQAVVFRRVCEQSWIDKDRPEALQAPHSDIAMGFSRLRQHDATFKRRVDFAAVAPVGRSLVDGPDHTTLVEEMPRRRVIAAGEARAG